MCDYSLMAIPNRLATQGEELVAHRFHTGSLGFASPCDLRLRPDPAQARRGFWWTLKNTFDPPRTTTVRAVCVPPGARLTLHDIPTRLQRSLQVSPSEEVTFTQLSAALNTYRDGIRFNNGHEISLQELREGQRAKILDLRTAETPTEVREEFQLR